MRFALVLAIASVAFAASAAPVREREFPDWKQCDPKWANVSLGNCSRSDTICVDGSTETCLAMLVASRGYKGNPGTFVDWLTNNGAYNDVDGWCVLDYTKIDPLGYSKYFDILENHGETTYRKVCALMEKGVGVLAWNGHNYLVTNCSEAGLKVNDPKCSPESEKCEDFMGITSAYQYTLFL